MSLRLLIATVIVLAITPMLIAGPSKGIKVGIVSSSQDFEFTSTGDPDFDRYRGLQLGLFLEYSLGPVLSFVGAADYTEHGFKFTTLEYPYDFPLTPPTSKENKNKVSYLSLGALLKVGFPLIGAKTYAIAGPRINLKVGSDGVFAARVYDEFKSAVMGVTAGLGQEFSLGFVSALVELTYNQDLTESYDDGDLTVKNSSFSFVAGVKF